jgi:hypothetical protein
LLVAGGIFGLFLALKRYVGRKLFGSDVFGAAEYYLGMVAGAVRFFLILIFALALFNAPQISDAELAKRIAAQNDSLGAIYFPPFGSIQRRSSAIPFPADSSTNNSPLNSSRSGAAARTR